MDKIIKPSTKEYKDILDKSLPDRSTSWPEFANNFLNKYFEGRSFTIWAFVSSLLIVLYGRYAIFPNTLMYYQALQFFSFLLLVFLVFFTLGKNLIYLNPFEIGVKLRRWIKFSQMYTLKGWITETSGAEAKKRDLAIKNIVNFKKICSRIKIIDPGSGRWRAGFIFSNFRNNREYIFHAFQDAGSDLFHARIVERIPGVEEIKPDVLKNNLGIHNTGEFYLLVEKENEAFNFYIDNIFIGTYPVPVEEISNIILAAWSDEKPITISFEDVEVWV